MRTILENQEALLADARRLAAYRKALQQVVRPEDVVLDLGSGSGVLGLLALRAGAGQVVAVDASPALAIAREAARRNGYSDRVTHRAVHSSKLVLAAPADVVVCDQMGPLGWEGGLIDTMNDAAARLVRRGGTLVPCRVETWFAPAERPTIRARLDRRDRDIATLDYAFLRDWSASTLLTLPQDARGDLLAAGQRLCAWDFGTPGQSSHACSADAEWTFSRKRRLDGFEGWFKATLAGEIAITNGPATGVVIRRPRRFLPLRTAIQVAPGDRLKLHLSVRPAGPIVQWSGSVVRDGRIVARFANSNLAGFVRAARHAADAAS